MEGGGASTDQQSVTLPPDHISLIISKMIATDMLLITFLVHGPIKKIHYQKTPNCMMIVQVSSTLT